MCDTISLEVSKILKKVVNGNVDDFVITVHDPNKKGEGYLGEMLFVTLQDKKTHREFNVIVKQAFIEKSIRDTLPIRDVFVNEICFYAEVWPQLNKFQERIPAEYQFQKVPRCLASSLEDTSEKLVLENLKFQKFQVHDKKIPLSKEHFELILKEYGKFHAVSFAYKELYPEEYAELSKKLKNIYSEMLNVDFFPKGIQFIFEKCMQSLQPGTDDGVIEKFRPYLENHKERFFDVKCKPRYTTITHGDCWSNNMMFKYNDSGKVTDVRFLDFQLARDASPCCDLSYCIYSGAPKEVLQNLDQYLQLYHQSLSKTLREFGCDPEKIYPLAEMKKDWKTHCNLGFTMGLMVWKVKFSYEDEIKDFTDLGSDEQEQILHSSYDEDAYKRVARDILLHLYENDYL